MDADETTNKPIESKVGINLVVTGKYKQGVTGKKWETIKYCHSTINMTKIS